MANGWAPFRITADEVESFASLDGMAAASDAVVLGRFVRQLPDRVIQGDAREDQVAYARAEFAVDQVIAGKSNPTLVVELLTLDKTSEIPIAETPVLMFAHEKRGDVEAGLYRAITSNGLLLGAEGEEVFAPLAENSSQTVEWLTKQTGGGALTLKKVIAEIK